MTTNIDLSKLPTNILRKVITFRERIERLEHGLEGLLKEALIGGNAEPSFKTVRKGFSAATRKKMAAAAKLRWAKKGGAVKAVKKGRRKMSAATKAKMAAAAKARWAKAKKAGKNSL